MRPEVGMRVGICDDEDAQISALAAQCIACCREIGTECHIVEFRSGQEVADYKGELLHLLFLDIEMPGMSGVQAMKLIETSNFVWRIVFVSSHVEEVWAAFGLKTLDFGRKPVSYDSVMKWIKMALQEFSEEIVIKFDKDNTDTYQMVSNIIYLEAEGNYVKVHSKERNFLVSRNLKYWEDKLPGKYFVRIHKSFLVNFEYIDYINIIVALKNNHVKFPVGRSYRKSLQSRYNTYIIEKIKGRIC